MTLYNLLLFQFQYQFHPAPNATKMETDILNFMSTHSATLMVCRQICFADVVYSHVAYSYHPCVLLSTCVHACFECSCICYKFA